ncbi:MAG: Dabb family protein [Saprospiraceae bacterium]
MLKFLITPIFLLGTTLMMAQITPMPESTPSNVLRHVVSFKFKEDAPSAKIDEIIAAFEALPGKIPQIRGFEWGLNNSPEGHDKGFTHVFFLTFHSEEDRSIYLPHPDHQAFGALLSPHLADVMVVDYWTR